MNVTNNIPNWVPKYLRKDKYWLYDKILEARKEEERGRKYLKSEEYKQHRIDFARFSNGTDKQIGNLYYQLTNESDFDCVELFVSLRNRKFKMWDGVKESNKNDMRFLKYAEHYGTALEPRIYGKYMFFMIQCREQPPYTAILKCYVLKDGEDKSIPEIDEYGCAYVFREQWRRYFLYAQ